MKDMLDKCVPHDTEPGRRRHRRQPQAHNEGQGEMSFFQWVVIQESRV